MVQCVVVGCMNSKHGDIVNDSVGSEQQRAEDCLSLEIKPPLHPTAFG